MSGSLKSAKQLWQLYRTSESWEGKAARWLTDISLQSLISGLEVNDANIRIVSIRLIEALGDPRAIRFLLKLQDDCTANYATGLQVDEDEEAVLVGETARAAIATLLRRKKKC